MTASAAARRLGVSAKALRLYEQHGLLAPGRNAAGWRVYREPDLARAARIVSLRAAGLGLAQIRHVVDGAAQDTAPLLAAHQAGLQARLRDVAHQLERLHGLRDKTASSGDARAADPRAQGLPAAPATDIVFELPWPWGGERFELSGMRAQTYIVGPLGSGKTRLAKRLAEVLPGARFLPMERVPAGATSAQALRILMGGLQARRPTAFVVDMVEQGLSEAHQRSVQAWLRRRGPEARPIFMLTRSSAILDLAATGPDEAILLCPANHSPPTWVAPWPGAPGYEAVASCLASPAVRARTAGVAARDPVLDRA